MSTIPTTCYKVPTTLAGLVEEIAYSAYEERSSEFTSFAHCIHGAAITPVEALGMVVTFEVEGDPEGETVHFEVRMEDQLLAAGTVDSRTGAKVYP